MSYKVKNTIVSILTGVLLMAAYCIYAFRKVQLGAVAPDDMKFWATTILVFIGIGIAAMIVIQIIFRILLCIAMAVKDQVQNGKCDDKKIEKTLELEMVEDEMDKLIGLKSMRIGSSIAGIGFIAALAAIVLNYSPAVMLNILFLSFGASTLASGALSIYYYRKGI